MDCPSIFQNSLQYDNFTSDSRKQVNICPRIMLKMAYLPDGR